MDQEIQDHIDRLERMGLKGTLEKIARQHHTLLEDILGPLKGTYRVQQARHACMRLLRVEMKMSLHEVGNIMRRDHTTVISSVGVLGNRKEVARAQGAGTVSRRARARKRARA
jgi:chromosomal replication initiation ATPase DnaA